MERLTNTQGIPTKCVDCPEYSDCCGSLQCDEVDNCLKRLKDYEDTNLTPEQMLEIDRMYREQCRELDEFKKKLMESSSHSEFDAHKTPIGKRLDAGLYD